MKPLQTYHPALKGIALFLAMMILFVQFTEAVHHHAHSGKATDTRLSFHQGRAQVTPDCAVCHYFAHHQVPAQPALNCFIFANAELPQPAAAPSFLLLLSGLCLTLSNKGPPALSEFLSC